jgi:hypothetical protein
LRRTGTSNTLKLLLKSNKSKIKTKAKTKAKINKIIQNKIKSSKNKQNQAKAKNKQNKIKNIRKYSYSVKLGMRYTSYQTKPTFIVIPVIIIFQYTTNYKNNQ